MVEEAQDRAAVKFLPPPVYPVVAVGVGIAIDRLLWPSPILISSRFVSIAVGVAVGVIGVALNLVALVPFRRTGQDPNPYKATPEVVDHGIYRYSRNPMYVGIFLVQVGVGIALNNLWIILLVIPVSLLVHYGTILAEEAYLEQKFGEAYLKYKSRVRRWL